MAQFDRTVDARFRAAAFEWLSSQCAIHGDVLPRPVLTDEFEFAGHRIRLLGPQGIFKPKAMEMPLSIASVPSGPYGDAFGSDNLLLARDVERGSSLSTCGGRAQCEQSHRPRQNPPLPVHPSQSS